ncbi:MAG: PQQ-dependent sugar dehydrogenase [Myxococcales bacterium]|nr:PQQ-dependent sugar dehydrogenase [Myxococcales bacterium]
MLALAGCDGDHDPSHTCADAAAACLDPGVQPADASAPLVAPPAPPAAPYPALGATAVAPRPRAETLACRVPPPVAAAGYTPVRRFEALRFDQPVWIGHAGDERLYVLEKCRGIKTFRPDDAAATTFLALQPACASEQGVLGLAFHPRHAENGLFYVYWSLEGPRRSRVSEFRRDPADPTRALPESERVVLEVEQPYGNHDGGDLHFGPDGYLYIALGDGGSGGDPQDHGQRPSTLLGSILRVDVDARSPGLAYGIPADNPFAGCTRTCGDGAPARPEVWAYGLRNPWRMRFDPVTGALWVGDVGQDRYEEIDRVEKGGNYGWRLREGFACFRGETCRDEGLVDPVFAYGRDVGASITGGLVYRGPDLPGLQGAYLFADFESGRVMALRERPEGASAELLAEVRRVTSFGEDAAGRLLLVTYGGEVWTLAPRGGEAGPPPPEKLSETGCFDDVASLAPAAGVLPYGVNVPFWSDGAAKQRFVAVPPGEVLGFAADETWAVPTGGVLLKTFAFAGEDGQPRPFEARIIARHAAGFTTLSYRFDADGRDATLVPAEGADAVVPTPEGPLPWRFPARGACARCHTDAAGFVLGLETRQLNGALGDENQVAALAAAGVLAGAPAPAGLPRHAPVGPTTPGVQAWLAVNCAGCHRPGGVANVGLDLRATADLGALCDVTPTASDLGLPGARLVAPGDPGRSVLLQRVLRRDVDGQMPPLATHRVDAAGAAALAAWISAGAACGP